MKQYIKLPIPKDTAWDTARFKWGRYIHWRIRYFFQGVLNIIRWMPTIFHDRDWDDYYITKMLQKKLEFHRAHLVSENRHVNIDRDNYWMTVVLNLLERKHSSYYQMERYEYMVHGPELFDDLISETLDEYMAKYPSAKRLAIKKYAKNNPRLNDKESISFYMCNIRQQKADDLIFEILKRHSAEWWD
jgi:hypothetical protein